MRFNNDSGFFSAFEHILRPMGLGKYRNYELPSTFQQRIDLIQSIKTAYRSDKEVFIRQCADDLSLERCLNHLNLDGDLSSLALMISGKTIANGESSLSLDVFAENILQKIAFLKKAEQFRALTWSDSFFQHLSTAMDLLTEEEFAYFIKYALDTNPHKTLDLETYPQVQNSTCMQIVQLLQKLDSPFIGFSKKGLFAAKEEKKEVEDLSSLKMNHKEFQLREYAWSKFFPEKDNDDLPLDQYKHKIADFEDYFNDFQNSPELMADFDDWLEAHPPLELKKTNTEFFEEKKVLTCREEAGLSFAVQGFK